MLRRPRRARWLMAGRKKGRPVAGSIGWAAAACAVRFFASAISLRWYNLQPQDYE